jgi:acyl-coenzyme A thioesterase PaaI-like protein
MSDVQTLEVGGRRLEVNAHHCFACGTLNTNGLRLDLHLEPGRAWTDVRLDRRFEGWEGVVHGGIVCTILDEVMAWSLVAQDAWGVTARMAVEFRSPIAVGTIVHAEGEVVDERRRLFRTRAGIHGPDGDLVATAEGTYLAARDAEKRALQERYGLRLLEPPQRGETARTRGSRNPPHAVAVDRS